MIKFYSINLIRFFGLVTAISLSGCNDRESINVNITTKYDPLFFGKDIQVSLKNMSNSAICFMKRDLDPTLPGVKIYQNNLAIIPDRQSNREIVILNGVDVSGGIEVVPNGTRNFFINIANFSLKTGPFSMIVRIKVAKCTELFSGRKIEWHVLTGKVVGSAS